MGELLGAGLSHYPPLCGRDEDMSHLLVATLEDESIPAEYRDVATWPAPMRAEWSHDRGAAAAAAHRSRLVEGFRRVRAAIDDFGPDAVVIIGDDQYENFREDLIPPFAVLAYDDMICRPWSEAQLSSAMTGRENVWGEPADTQVPVRGHPDIARELVTGLISRDIDIAYAYRPLHHPSLSHAFLNAVLFLDYDRRGFPHPVVPLAVNCYGRAVVSRRGFMARWDDSTRPDPPSPSPRRMMAVGSALAEVIASSELRIALVASSSWSHAFMCDKTHRLRPDTPADRLLFDLMTRGRYDELSDYALAEVEDSGQQEVLNWFVLFGAMARSGLTPSWATLVESHIFNSNKAFALYPVASG